MGHALPLQVAGPRPSRCSLCIYNALQIVISSTWWDPAAG